MPRSYTPPECDVVVLAGDISTGVAGVIWAYETFTVPVVYVPGNHEFYGKRLYHRHIEKLKAKAEGSNVRVLTNDALVLDGVRFLGCTFWTDFNLFGSEHLSEMVAQREMNDYDSIKIDHSRFLRAADTRSFNLESKFFLSEAMRIPFDGPTVIVTHHAPSEKSIGPGFDGHVLNPAYASRMENFICDVAPKLWLHGHLHDSVDYQLCETRVVCNPRGYLGHHLNAGFDPALVLEV